MLNDDVVHNVVDAEIYARAFAYIYFSFFFVARTCVVAPRVRTL